MVCITFQEAQVRGDKIHCKASSPASHLPPWSNLVFYAAAHLSASAGTAEGVEVIVRCSLVPLSEIGSELGVRGALTLNFWAF